MEIKKIETPIIYVPNNLKDL